MTEISFEGRGRLARTPAHDVALDCLAAGVAAALPERTIDERVSVDDGALRIDAVDGETAEYDLDTYDAVRLVGAGKAAGGTGRALADALGDRPGGGAVVTTDPDAGSESLPFEVLPGDHPLPSDRGVASTRRVIEVAESAGTDDLVVAVVTGGGSALLAAPADPLTVEDLRALTDELLACGASIDEINAVRKHCSAVKGGRLARIAAPATVVTLAVSDVIGDDVGVIASGPTAPDPSTYAEALAVCDRYDLDSRRRFASISVRALPASGRRHRLRRIPPSTGPERSSSATAGARSTRRHRRRPSADTTRSFSLPASAENPGRPRSPTSR